MSDLIKREDAINALDNWCYKDDIEAEIRAIPSIEPKRGEWIPNSPFTGNCSECGADGNLKDTFCSKCGALMREREDE